jgi:serine/threonine protein phosphatase PrpC
VITVDACGMTDIGPVRDQNQDAIVLAGMVGIRSGARLSWTGELHDSSTFAVVDGMGGYAGGADAAALVATALASSDLSADEAKTNLQFELLSERVMQAGNAWGTPEMGATTAVLTITLDGLLMANVGDCRIYRINGGRLGSMSVDDRTDDLSSSAVTQALGGVKQLNTHFYCQELKTERDRYILCSDGVWGALSDEKILDFCAIVHSPAQSIEAIASAIYAHNATDNCSAIVVDVIFDSNQTTKVDRRACDV